MQQKCVKLVLDRLLAAKLQELAFLGGDSAEFALCSVLALRHKVDLLVDAVDGLIYSLAHILAHHLQLVIERLQCHIALLCRVGKIEIFEHKRIIGGQRLSGLSRAYSKGNNRVVVGRVVDKVLHHLQHLTLCVELHLSMLALVALVVHQRDVGIHVHQIVLALILLNFALACREFIVDNRESLINEFSRIDCHLVLLHLAAAVVERDHSVEHIFATLHIAVFDIEVQAVTLFRDDAHRHLFIKVFSSHLVAGYANTHIQFLTGDVIFSGVEHKDTIIGLQRHREFLGSNFGKGLK